MYEITHSLLSAWLYAMKPNPYEDATCERDSMEEFMHSLRREKTEPNEAMLKGLRFEDEVQAICENRCENPEFSSSTRMAEMLKGGTFQITATKAVAIACETFFLKGRLDVLRGGTCYDIKCVGKYERGKYFDSTQHPMYFALCPEVNDFVYTISDGTSIWTEAYRRDETRPIEPIIADFYKWLEANNLVELYKEKWKIER